MTDSSGEKSLQVDFNDQLRSKELFEMAKTYAFDYMDTLDEWPVFPSDDSIQRLEEFSEKMPETRQSSKEVLHMLQRLGSPACVRQTGGRYFGFVNGNILPVAAASRWLVDVWDQNTALYAMSPVASKLEEVTESWISNLLGLPESTAMGLVGGSSVATLCALAAARNSLLAKKGWNVSSDGLFGAPPLRVVVSEQAHSSVFKALSLVGLGRNRVELVPADSQGRIDLNSLPPLDSSTLVILQAGHVCTGSFDPFDSICDQAAAAGAWVHIDGAFGLWAAASPRFCDITKGLERADSWCGDAHKTLNAPYDCGIVLCKHREALKEAMAASGSYLQESNSHRDSMFYTPDMSRRARSVDLWVCLRTLGRSGVVELVDGLVDRAQEFAVLLRDAGFLVLNDVVFNQCLVRCETCHQTSLTLERLQQSGKMWCGGTKWNGKVAIRISCCSWATTAQDVRECVDIFISTKM